MGLDMYLEKRIYVGANYSTSDVDGTIFIMRAGKKIPIDFNKVSEIIQRAGYWRKANAIHKWFVDNVQGGDDDCKEYTVSREKLEQLYKLVKKVLRHPELAPELLPTQSGFFFGGTDYDEYYFDDLKSTVNILKPILKEEEDWNVTYTYQSSW